MPKVVAGSIYHAERDAYILQTKEANITKFSSSLKKTAKEKVLKDCPLWSNKNRLQLKPQLQFSSKQKEDKAVFTSKLS